jgi:hypothetical protein
VLENIAGPAGQQKNYLEKERIYYSGPMSFTFSLPDDPHRYRSKCCMGRGACAATWAASGAFFLVRPWYWQAFSIQARSITWAVGDASGPPTLLDDLGDAMLSQDGGNDLLARNVLIISSVAAMGSVDSEQWDELTSTANDLIVSAMKNARLRLFLSSLHYL